MMRCSSLIANSHDDSDRKHMGNMHLQRKHSHPHIHLQHVHLNDWWMSASIIGNYLSTPIMWGSYRSLLNQSQARWKFSPWSSVVEHAGYQMAWMAVVAKNFGAFGRSSEIRGFQIYLMYPRRSRNLPLLPEIHCFTGEKHAGKHAGKLLTVLVAGARDLLRAVSEQIRARRSAIFVVIVFKGRSPLSTPLYRMVNRSQWKKNRGGLSKDIAGIYP